MSDNFLHIVLDNECGQHVSLLAWNICQSETSRAHLYLFTVANHVQGGWLHPQSE